MLIEADHWRDVGEAWDKERWPDFVPREFACRHCSKIKMYEVVLDKLQAMRTALGPLHILSAYRCPLHNARVGGAPLSAHKFGKAVDISLSGLDKFALLDEAQRAGFSGFGFYGTFLHVDIGAPRSWGKPWA